MVFNTISVGTAVTPTVIETYFSHYLNRKPLGQKPTAHISYHEGVNIIRQFLAYASHHTVEDIQGFTSQWVPCPRWVKVDEVTITQKIISEAADAVITQLGHHGVDKVGGQNWWQWRREGSTLQAEWIEMRRDHTKRKATEEKGKRVMLYVHGGAYFFGSVDEHRYQLQRHAPRYRLAPQFPFPCGLLDCLAAYLYLLTVQDASEIVLAGDSAGGGMIVSILVILRDRGLPLPAGAILISPWVDLTHSFPSVAGDGSSDYIPAHGFLQRPSASWPPPNTNDMEEIAIHAVEQVAGEALPRKSSQAARHKAQEEAIQGFSADHDPGPHNTRENADNHYGTNDAGKRAGNTIPGTGHDLSIMLDGNPVMIEDQIQMYTTNQLISHPLVSPVLQPSLGGLPPLLILTGGGEVLRDEQIYLAHKAANPAKYPPGEAYLDEYPEARDLIAKWKPTDVQLQVWDDLCHVAPTLSFTRPAKYMYRSIAQFGAWALARAQKTEIQIMDDDEVSVISESASESDDDLKKPEIKSTVRDDAAHDGTANNDEVGRAGQPLPSFKNHMIRQRVDRHGNIFPLDPPSSIPALQVPPDEVGVIKPGPVQKWLKAKRDWDTKYAREKRKVQRQRIKEMAEGYQGFGDDEVPPPSALAGRRGLRMPKGEKRKRSWGMSLWASWGSTHDEHTMNREEKADKAVGTSTATKTNGANDGSADATRAHDLSRSRSRRRDVADIGQANGYVDENTSAAELDRRQEEKSPTNGMALAPNHLAPSVVVSDHSITEPKDQAASQFLSPNANRPKSDGIAFPFKLSTHLVDDGRNASTVTLQSQAGVVTPPDDEECRQLGASVDHRTEDESKLRGSEKAEPPISTNEAKAPTEEPAESDDEGWKQAAQDKKIRLINGGDDQEYPGMQRRGTLEDAQGVLHYGPKEAENAERKRPQIDRAETASLD